MTNVVLLILLSVVSGIAVVLELRNRRCRAFLDSVSRLGEDVAPVWASQIDKSRSQMDHAISSLIGEFAAIIAQLEIALAKSGDALGGDNGDVVGESRRTLDEVTALLSRMVAQREETAMEFDRLRSLNSQMNELTQTITKIASDTYLVSLNASIEASRFGHEGDAFAVVAGEVRDLAEKSRTAGERIQEMTNLVEQTIASTLGGSTASAEELELMRTAEARVQNVVCELETFISTLQDASSGLGAAAGEIKSEISSAIVQLQFQDRVGQILEHVQASVSTLPSVLEQAGLRSNGRPRSIDTAAIVADLEATYTMKDEFDSGVETNSEAESDVTFF